MIALFENSSELYEWLNWTAPELSHQYADYGWIPLSEYDTATIWDWGKHATIAMLCLCCWMAGKHFKEIGFRSAWRLIFMAACISYTISAYRTCIDGNFTGAGWYILHYGIAAVASIIIQVYQKPKRNRVGFIFYDGQALGV